MEPFLTQNVFLFSTTLAPHFFHILAQIKTEMMAVEFPLEWWWFIFWRMSLLFLVYECKETKGSVVYDVESSPKAQFRNKLVTN